MSARPVGQVAWQTVEAHRLPLVASAGLDGYMAECQSRIDGEIVDLIDAQVDDAWMRGAIGYQLGWADEDFLPLAGGGLRTRGSRLRPLLALLCFHCARAVPEPGAGGVEDVGVDEAILFAAALDCLHNFSLIHDDIQNGERLRRGRPTLWHLCGPAQALNVGDCLHALAYACLGRLHGRGADQGLVGELVGALAKATVDMTVGQRRDRTYQSTGDVDFEMHAAMIAGRTAALMACASYGGALIALGHRGRVAYQRAARYAEFGRHLGLCLQIRQDILGIWGVEAETGKPTDGDIRRRKMSLPVVIALRHAGGGAGERLRYLYRLPGELTREQELEVRHILDGCRAADACQRHVEVHAEEARRSLAGAVAGTDGVAGSRFLEALRALTGSAA